MKINRRNFFGAMAATVAASSPTSTAEASSAGEDPRQIYGMLCDTTLCIGCRKCEFACNREHSLSERGLDQFEDFSVFDEARRMEADSYTVVNRYSNPADAEKPTFVKVQCMHCLHPACASACLVGALRASDTGAVTYDAAKCMGCRYCMVACPFQVPTYEYDNVLTPRVMKCTFCAEKVAEDGGVPACAEMCPPGALMYGQRSELLEIAHQRIAADPNRYVDHVYGEQEVGGTAWLYLASQEFSKLGLLNLGTDAPPSLTETIQHSIFKFGIPPLMLYGLLGAAMLTNRGAHQDSQEGHGEVES